MDRARRAHRALVAPRPGPRARALSAAGFPAVGLTLTFAAFDWLMSLTPLWYSTIFGLLYFALLSRPLKRRLTLLALVGGWLVAMNYVDVAWLVMPVLHPQLSLHWLDLAAPCAVLGLATAATAARPRSRLAVAPGDPRLAAAAHDEGT